MRRWWLALAVALALAGGAWPAGAQGGEDAAARRALGWLVQRQANDGSFPGFDAGATADAVFALVAAGRDPATVAKGGRSPLDYLQAQAGDYAAKSVAAAAKLALAAVAAGADPRSFGGQDLLARLGDGYDASSGRYGTSVTDHALALLAVAGAGQPVPDAATSALVALQLPDGGWSFDGTAQTGSDTNTTALAVQALTAAGAGGDAVGRAVAYLKAQQNPDGGFPYAKGSSFGSASDANSTALAIQALLAAGVDPATAVQGGSDPLAGLLQFQKSSGAFSYQLSAPDDNDLATAQAIPALLRKPLPLRVAGQATAPISRLPASGGAAPPLWPLPLAVALLALGSLLRRAALRW